MVRDASLRNKAVLAVLTHGADHVIALIGFRHQARDLLRRVLQIGIQGDDQIARHVAEPGHNRRVLAVVAVEQHGNDVAAFGLGAASVSISAESSLLPSSTSRIS